MKWKNVVLGVIVAALCLAGVAASLAGCQNAHDKTHVGTNAAKQYRCPMHPQVVSDRPGSCPICHMRLELVEDTATASSAPISQDQVPGHAVVHIGPEKQQLIGMKIWAVKQEILTKTIRTTGRVAYDPELYEAQEEYLEARLGQKVGQKPPLGYLDPKGYAYYTKKWGLPLQEKIRSKLLFMGMNDALIEELWKTGEPDRRLLFPKESGEIWVYALLYETDLASVREGDALQYSAHAVGIHGEAPVRAVGTVIDPATRTVVVRALAPNPDRTLTPEMFLDVQISTRLGKMLAVPEEAVVFSGKETLVFVEKENGHFEPRPVVLGRKSDDFYEIRAGLSEGESVVESGNFLVDSESRLKAALKNFGEHVHEKEPSK